MKPDLIAAPTRSAEAILQRLVDVIQPRKRLMIAYSGGIDSTVVAAAAVKALGEDHALAVIGDSASLPRFELDEARTIAQQIGIPLVEVQPDEQNDPGYIANAGNRCYHCKTHLYASVHQLAKEQSFDYIANGTNADDLGDHRPGLVAADEAEVVSPLVEAEMNKQDVRAVAELLQLPNADKPAAACLASRIPYGTPVTPEALARIEAAEDCMRELGFRGYRVRDHHPVARIELPWDQVPKLMEEATRQAIIDGMKQAGYTYTSLDLEGFRSGSGNVMLTINTTSPSKNS